MDKNNIKLEEMREEARIAAIEDNVDLVSLSWSILSEQQEAELLEVAYHHRAWKVIGFISKKMNQSVAGTPLKLTMDKLFEQSVAQSDIEMSISLFHSLPTYAIIFNRGARSKQESFLNWAISNNHFHIIPKLDISQCSELSKLKLLMQISIKYNTNKESRVIPMAPDIDISDIQLILKMLEKENINIFNQVEKILHEIIDPTGIYYHNSETVIPTKEYILEYIDNDDFLKEVSYRHYPHLSVDELKQHLLNLSFERSVKKSNVDNMVYLLNKGAKLNVCKEEKILNLLKYKQLDLLETLVEAGADIEKYKKEVLEHHCKDQNVPIIKYLIQLFSHKKELWLQIEEIITSQMEEKLKESAFMEHQKQKFLNFKQEIKEYMDKLIFEEKLQAELPTNSSTAKIKL